MAANDDEERQLRSVALQNAQSILQTRERAEEALRKQVEWLRVTLASIGDAVISTDAQGRVSFMNGVAESLTGWLQAEAMGRPLEEVFSIVNEQSGGPVENPALQALRDGTCVGLANHTLLIARDGTERSIDDSASPILDEHGAIAGCVLIFRDVSQQRQVVRALEQSEARKAAILETALDCIISSDHEGRIIEFNAAAERTFGYRREDILGQAMVDVIIPPSLRQRHWEGMARFMDTRESRILGQRLVLTGLRADGSEFPIELAVTQILTDGPPLFTAYLRDISERVQAEEAARESDRRKDEFLAILAHELRNPLAPILNAVQILRAKGSGATDLQFATEVIDRQVHQLARLVDDLLDVSRITRGTIELRRQWVELSDVVTSAVEASRPLIQMRGHELTVVIPAQPIHLNADPTRLAQVLLNLLNNAAKYMDHGGSIALTAVPLSDHLLIRIKDTGIGIPPDMLQRIFDIFTQVDRSLERSEGGLGIGLTLVKRLVEMHGGTVEAHSDGLGIGSEFVVRLPLAVAATGDTSQAPAGDDLVAAPASGRILVVDDNRDIADSLAILLRMLGYEVQAAHDGLEAVAAAAAFQPDVVLLDIGLPKLNGYEAARRIRELEGGPDIVLVALTGWGQEENRRRSMEAGFDHHMTKPVEFAALKELLAESVRGR